MVKYGTSVVSGSKGTASTPGPTRVTIQSSMSEGDVGMLPPSFPGEGATDTPVEDVGGEAPPFDRNPLCLVLQGQRSKGTLRYTWPVQEPC